MKILRALILFLCLAAGFTPLPPAVQARAVPSSALADPPILVWTGASLASNNWSDELNWTLFGSLPPTRRVPRDGDILAFDDSAAQLKSNNDMKIQLHLTGIGIGSGKIVIEGFAVTVDQLAMDTKDITGTSIIVMPLTLGKISVPVNIASAFSTLDIRGALTGAGKLDKQGPGTLILGADCTYTGGLTVEAGTVNLLKRAAAGTGLLEIKGAAKLIFGSDPGGVNNPVQFTEGGTLSLGTTPIYFYNPVTLSMTGTNTGVVEIPTDDNLIIYGVVQGTGNLAKRGAGNLSLYGGAANTYTGKMTVETGTLTLQNYSGPSITGELELKTGADAAHPTQLITLKNNQFSSTTVVKTNSNSEIHLHGTTQAILALSGQAGTLIMDEGSEPAGLLTLSGLAAVQYYFSHIIVKGSGKIAIGGVSGSVQGMGYNSTQAAPLFSGPIEVNGPGYYLATGFYSGGPLIVNSGTGELMYDSQFSSVIGNGGIIMVTPGMSASSYPTVGGILLSSTAEFDPRNLDPHPLILQVNGPVILGEAGFKLVFATSAYPSFATPYILISNDGTDPVSGTFKDLPNGGRTSAKEWGGPDNQGFIINYAGGDGNDITVTRLARPALQLIAPASVAYGKQIQLVASFSTSDPVALPIGATVNFYCGGQLAGSAQFQAGGSSSTQALLTLPKEYTRIGLLRCYAQFPITEAFDSATSTTQIITVTGQQVFMPYLRR